MTLVNPLDERLENLWEKLDPILQERILEEFFIPKFHDIITELKSSKKRSTPLLTIIQFRSKTGIELGSLNNLAIYSEMRYIKYGKMRLIPETEAARLNNMPDRKANFEGRMVTPTYGIKRDSIEALVQAGILKRNNNRDPDIRGPNLYRLLKFLSGKKYETLGTIPLPEWVNYTWNGKPLKFPGADAEELPMPKQYAFNPKVKKFFEGLEKEDYCCIVFALHEKGAALFYVPINSRKNGLQRGFVDAGKFFAEKVDSKAKCVHYQEYDGKAIGGIHAKTLSALVNFIGQHCIKIYVSNVLHTGKTFYSEAEEIVADAFKALRKTPKSSHLVEPLPLYGPYKKLLDMVLTGK